MILAGIDIGSNAMRMKINEVMYRPFEGSFDVITQKPLYYDRKPIRLGSSVFQNGKVSAERIDTLIAVLKYYQFLIEHYLVQAYLVVGTSALRSAKNKKRVIKRVKEETGVPLSLISGVEEASLILKALVNRYALREKEAVLVDVGGGSVEVSFLSFGELSLQKSFPLGTVRLKSLLSSEAEAHEFIKEKVTSALLDCKERFREEKKDRPLIGVFTGGNIRALNKLHKIFLREEKIKYFEKMSLQELLETRDVLKRYSPKDREYKFLLRPDRADVIYLASEIYAVISQVLGIQEIIASDVGLVDGLIDVLIHKVISRPGFHYSIPLSYTEAD